MKTPEYQNIVRYVLEIDFEFGLISLCRNDVKHYGHVITVLDRNLQNL